jgi:colicin import membrane protein
MSATVYYEPYRLPAGILALVVHSAFFALLYFGFNWNRQVSSPATMSVELWPSLPEEVVAPPATPKVEEVVQPPPQEKIVEPDIVMPEKKKPVARPVKEVETRRAVTKAVEKKPVDKPSIAYQRAAREQAMMAEQAAREQAEKAAREASNRVEQAAANGRVVDEYQAKIRAKIRSKIVEPPDVAQDARAEFLVTLLPDGDVLTAELKKSSGNAAYDIAVERAIWKSVRLPLPPDVALFSAFRELLLTFKPEKPTE